MAMANAIIVNLEHQKIPPPPPIKPVDKVEERPQRKSIKFLACDPDRDPEGGAPRIQVNNPLRIHLWCNTNDFGQVLRNDSDVGRENIAEYRFSPTAPGKYVLKINYGYRAHEDRSVLILINDKKVFMQAGANVVFAEQMVSRIYRDQIVHALCAARVAITPCCINGRRADALLGEGLINHRYR
jgi:hypothetical protein